MRNLIFVILLLLANKPVFSTEAQAEGTLTLSFAEVWKRFSLDGNQDLNSTLARLAKERVSSTLREPTSIEIESEGGLKSDSERRVSLGIDHQWSLGSSTSKIEGYQKSLTDAEALRFESKKAQNKIMLHGYFNELALSHQQFAVLQAFSKDLLPFLAAAEQASKQGAIPIVRMRNLKIFGEGVERELALARKHFLVKASLFSALTKLTIPEDPNSIRFAGIAPEVPTLNLQTYLPLKASRLEQTGLREEAANLDGLYTITTGIGSYHDLESREYGYMAKLSIPLWNKHRVEASTSRLRALELENEEQEILVQAEEDQLLLRKTAVVKEEELSGTEAKIGALTKLFDDISVGFKRGYSDLADVLDTLRDLREARLHQAQLTFELEQIKSKSFLFSETKP